MVHSVKHLHVVASSTVTTTHTTLSMSYMAQAFLIKEFGGYITDWNGNELNLDSNGKVVASYDSNHHKTILGLLNEIK